MAKSTHIFHFTGNLHLRLEAALSAWQKAFRDKHGDLNLSRCSLVDIPPDQLSGELSTPPFLAEKRLTLVTVSGDLPKNFTQYSEPAYWERLFATIPEDHIVAFISAEGLSPMADLLAKIAIIKDYSLGTPQEIQTYIEERLPNMPRSGARLLATRIGDNLLLLENEIQKLALLDTITEADILENTIESVEVKMFQLIDTIMSGDIRKSRELFRKYLAQSEDFEFLTSFLGAVRKAGLYAGLVGNGVSHNVAANGLDLHSFVADKYRGIPPSRLRAFGGLYVFLAEADLSLKTGKLIGDAGLLHHLES